MTGPAKVWATNLTHAKCGGRLRGEEHPKTVFRYDNTLTTYGTEDVGRCMTCGLVGVMIDPTKKKGHWRDT